MSDMPTQDESWRAVTIAHTTTGVFRFSYGGPPTPVAEFGTLFSPEVAAVNVLILPQARYASWFREAPELATATALSTRQIVCVAGPVGAKVFPS